MGKRPKRSPGDQAELAAIGARIQKVLNLKFGAGQHTLSQATGVSQPTWSRVIAGRQAPSWKLLVALIDQGINPEWVLTGRGQPFFEATAEHRSGQPIFLVAKWILPGQPEEHREHLVGLDLRVEDLTRSNSRYWLQVQPVDPIVREPDEDVRPGDLLLLETNPNYWLDNLSRLDDQLGAIRIRTAKGDLLVLGRVRIESGDPHQPRLSANVFGRGEIPIESPAHEKGTYGKELRAIDLREAKSPSRAGRPADEKDSLSEASLAELVAVNIYTWRP